MYTLLGVNTQLTALRYSTMSLTYLSQGSSLRKSIRRSKMQLVENIGTAEMEQEVRKRILKIVEEGKDKMEEQTGGLSYSVTEKM